MITHASIPRSLDQTFVGKTIKKLNNNCVFVFRVSVILGKPIPIHTASVWKTRTAQDCYVTSLLSSKALLLILCVHGSFLSHALAIPCTKWITSQQYAYLSA